MSAISLSSRAIIGSFYDRLNVVTGNSWFDPISMMFTSDMESETYKWLGNAPAMRQWVGGRQAKGFRENGLTITNLHYEATMEVLVREARRDKTGQVMVRINEMADRAQSHWASLLSTLIINGETTACYDGQYFFDTDHSEGSSGTLSNDITVDISTLPTVVHGSTTAPSVEELQGTVIQAAQAMYGFKDDVGEPMNEGARSFLVMVPVSMWATAQAAFRQSLSQSGMTNPVMVLDGINFAIAPNPRLTWTDKLAVFRTDGSVKPFIRQEEAPLMIKSKAEGSEYEFDNDAWQFGIDTWRNVGYGYWQHACLATMI